MHLIHIQDLFIRIMPTITAYKIRMVVLWNQPRINCWCLELEVVKISIENKLNTYTKMIHQILGFPNTTLKNLQWRQDSNKVNSKIIKPQNICKVYIKYTNCKNLTLRSKSHFKCQK